MSTSRHWRVLSGVAAILGFLATGCGRGEDTRTVTSAGTALPIQGGTLAVSPEGIAIASDPEHDVVWLVDLAAAAAGASDVDVVRWIDVPHGSEPGRVVAGQPGRAFVALRRGGAVLELDLVNHQIAQRAPICAAPRGLAFDGDAMLVHVACAGGELVSLDATTLAPVRTLTLAPDLRDVFLTNRPADRRLVVTRFRSAAVFTVDAQGNASTETFPMPSGGRVPTVAWRAVTAPVGGVLIAHEEAVTTSIDLQSGGDGEGGGGPTMANAPSAPSDPSSSSPSAYGASAADDDPDNLHVGHTVVRGSFSWISVDGTHGPGGFLTMPIRMALPVDLVSIPSVRADIPAVLIADAGNDRIMKLDLSTEAVSIAMPGTPVALATWGARAVAQLRDPPQLVDATGTGAFRPIRLPATRVNDEGQAIFHRASQAGNSMACASCHPEGGDDGHVWSFSPIGLRRTPSLRGGLLATAPFHWDGDITDMNGLVHEVFERRMGGAKLSPASIDRLGTWLDGLKKETVVSTPANTRVVERGSELFADGTVGCAGCHAGPLYTNNEWADVGTGSAFQVPPLRDLGVRSGFLHDGRATTLKDRFGPAGGGDLHGHTSQLPPEDIDALVAFLATL